MNKFQRRAEYHMVTAGQAFATATGQMPDIDEPMTVFAAKAENYVRFNLESQALAAAQLQAARLLASYGALVERGDWSEAQAIRELERELRRNAARIDSSMQTLPTLLVGVLARDLEHLDVDVYHKDF